MPHARYYQWDKGSEHWVALDFDQLGQVHSMRLPRRGVVELFCQQMTVAQELPDTTMFVRDIIVPPRVVANNTASLALAATDSGVPSLSLSSLTELCKIMKWIMIYECPDNAGAYRRKMFGAAARLPANALFAPGGCAVHSSVRIFASLDSGSLIGDAYAVAFLTHLVSHYTSLWRALRQLVFTELLVVKRSDVSDAEFAEWQAHTKCLLEHTLRRKSLQTRGRLDKDDGALKPARLEAARRPNVGAPSPANQIPDSTMF